MSLPPHLIAETHQVALVGDDYASDFRFDWFDADYWGSQATPVATGGRGAAWFIASPLASWVLRHYCRGGLPARLIKNHYLFLGQARVRSLQEYKLLSQLVAWGLPVPEPIAAAYQRQGASYTAAILVRRLEDTLTLQACQSEDDEPLWQLAGACIRRFHELGVFHADLNCSNILVNKSAQQIYLIDFDRGHLHRDQRSKAPWKQANLDRLQRSVEKKLPHLPAALREGLFAALLRGYHQPA